MILFKVTNTVNNKVYINYKLGFPVNLYRLKNKDLKKDLLEFGLNNFDITILYESDDKKSIKDEYKKFIDEYMLLDKNLLYNSTSRGTIVVKDENGKNIKISVYDDRYTSGKLKHVSIGRIPVINIETNQTTSIFANDPLYNIKYIPVTKGKVITKDINNNYFFIEKTDPRYLNNELKFVMNDKEISKRGIQTKLKNYILNRSSLYSDFNFSVEHDNKTKTYVVKNFCKHGDLHINPELFKILYNDKNSFMCEQCKEEFYKEYVSNQEELEYFQNLYKIFNINLYVESYVKMIFQKLYFYIYDFTKHCLDLPWNQRVYLFKNNLSEIPKCKYEDCTNYATYNYGSKFYNMYCKEHADLFIRSNGEKEIFNFISKFYTKQIDINYRHIIGMELDIFIPEEKIAIEFNGIYWHSENFKDSKYHFQKWNRCNKKGIKLITIWEDDWANKQDIVKSFIQNKCKFNT